MHQIRHQKIIQILWYSLPAIIILSMVWLTQSPLFAPHANQLAFAITIDLLVTAPLVYFLIIRKKAIPNTSIVLVIGIGVIVASMILPKSHQNTLEFIKFWILPFIELFVVSYVIYTVRKSIKAFKLTESYDFHANIKIALAAIMPQKVIGFVSMEISAFYYAFVNWKKLKLKPNEYAYHHESGTRAVLLVLLFLIAIETFVFHLLLQNWSSLVAWILSVLSIYSGFQILGILKSLSQRPIVIRGHQIILRYGILAEGEISIHQIKSIQGFKGEIIDEPEIQSFSPLGGIEGHNVLIELHAPFSYTGFYGLKKEAKTLALFIDDPVRFTSTVKSLLKN